MCGALFAVPNSLGVGCASVRGPSSVLLLLLPVCLLGLDAAAAFSTPFCVSIIDNSFNEKEGERGPSIHRLQKIRVHNSGRDNDNCLVTPNLTLCPAASKNPNSSLSPSLPSPLLAALKLGPF